ncbi:helix-turn-helix domain-containing protein [Pokkaliibacter sp. CJK22405]|uniref:helix-turn-helix domain-containing protein n=1 Tax=Pokkaliibacter sp. CJK22405 TaxID=3384615 RepID=UPI0039852C3F
MSSEPVIKTLKVLELLSGEMKPLSMMDIARKSDIPPSTLSRIMATLEAAGYVQRNAGREYLSSFEIRKSLGLSQAYDAQLEWALEEIVDATEQSAEVLLYENKQLVWHAKREHSEMAIKLRAHKGFRRTIHELDAPSRLFLSAYGWNHIVQHLETDAFFTTGLERTFLKALETRQLIDRVDPDQVAFDEVGNVRGVRRFAKLVRDVQGRPLHLLCIAEPAIPKLDMQAHIRHHVEVLDRVSDRLGETLRKLAGEQAP